MNERSSQGTDLSALTVNMATKRDEMTVWTGYFDSRLSRNQGRRVPKESSIPKPTLDAVIWAARRAGIRKMRQEPEACHPSRPYAKEGRVIMPPSHALDATGSKSKEGVMKKIGGILRIRSEDSKNSEKALIPAKGDRRQRAQRKAFKKRASGKRRSKFGKKK